MQTTKLSLFVQFLRSGMASAREAVRIFISNPDNVEGIAIHSGIAVESFAKARLVQENVALIFDRLDDNAVRLIAGVVEPSGTRSKIQTISGDAACRRILSLDPNFPYSASSGDGIVFLARNAAVHGASVDDDEAMSALACMVRTTNWLAIKIGLRGSDRFAMWREHQETARQLLLRRRSETEIRLLARINGARELYRRRFPGVPDDQVWSLLAPIKPAADDLGSDLYGVRASCPACPHSGWLHCEKVGTDAEDVHLNPLRLRCPSCSLILDGDELALVGLADELRVSPSAAIRGV